MTMVRNKDDQHTAKTRASKKKKIEARFERRYTLPLLELDDSSVL